MAERIQNKLEHSFVEDISDTACWRAGLLWDECNVNCDGRAGGHPGSRFLKTEGTLFEPPPPQRIGLGGAR